jgi:hypothetical protein
MKTFIVMERERHITGCSRKGAENVGNTLLYAIPPKCCKILEIYIDTDKKLCIILSSWNFL